MKTIAKAHFMNDFPCGKFRFCIPATNMRHTLAALFRGKDIHHKC